MEFPKQKDIKKQLMFACLQTKKYCYNIMHMSEGDRKTKISQKNIEVYKNDLEDNSKEKESK